MNDDQFDALVEQAAILIRLLDERFYELHRRTVPLPTLVDMLVRRSARRELPQSGGNVVALRPEPVALSHARLVITRQMLDAAERHYGRRDERGLLALLQAAMDRGLAALEAEAQCS